jgi:hypothetical protein
MGLCFSTSYVEEPVRPPVQTYVVQQQQVHPEPSAPRISYPPPNYIPTSQYTYAVPYSQSQGQSYPVKQQQSTNEDPQPVTYVQYPQYTQTMYPPPQTTMYVQQPVYRQPVQQNNTGMGIAGGFILGSVLADLMDDD